MTAHDRVHVFPFVADKVLAVPASDGLVLHVEIDEPTEPAEGAPTLVLAHGFCLDASGWCFQRHALVAEGYRVVTYDQRGHGQSGIGERDRSTIDQLGRDLRTVIDAAAPEGPLVLVGHSMGGMTIMSLAGHYPDLVRSRVRGVALVSTSAGGTGLVRLGLGKVLDLAVVRLGPGVLTNLARRAEVWTGMRRVGGSLLGQSTHQEIQLDIGRLLAPQRAVVVEDGDPVLGCHLRNGVFDEVDDRRLGRTVTPGVERGHG
mgnify:CR=1 FL=1